MHFTRLLLLFCLATSSVFADYLSNEFPVDTTGISSVTAVAQDNAGKMYFASPAGVTVFDGARWVLIPTDFTCSSILYDRPSDQIYIGGLGKIFKVTGSDLTLAGTASKKGNHEPVRALVSHGGVILGASSNEIITTGTEGSKVAPNWIQDLLVFKGDVYTLGGV